MHRPSPVLRIAAAVLIAALTAPVPGTAAEDETEAASDAEAATEAEAASDAEAATEAERPARVSVEAPWYDAVLHNTGVGVDLIVIRPLAAITLAAGALLFVPAAVMTAPNGWESVKEGYQRFIGEPADYLISRPLGEF